MGIGKFWIKHGLGSPGSIAKAMTKSYVKIKAHNPTLSNEQLLLLTLETRIRAEKTWGIQGFAEKDIAGLVQKANGSLEDLILYVVHRECSEADNISMNFPDLYQKMIEVIDEVVNKYLR